MQRNELGFADQLKVITTLELRLEIVFMVKSFKFICYLTQVIMAQEEILKKEKELEMARRKLDFIRKAKYRPDDDTTGSEL